MLKPEVHQPVLDLIAAMHAAHLAGKGVDLFDLVKMLGVSLQPQQEAMLRKRGQLVLAPVDGEAGTFSNQGEKLTIPAGIASVEVPPLLAGTYSSGQERFSLVFKASRTIRARAVIISADLQKFEVDNTFVRVDFSNERFNQLVKHG